MKKKWEFQWHINRVVLSSTVSSSDCTLEMLVFMEGGKPGNLVKKPWSRDENQQQTEPTKYQFSESKLGQISGRQVLSSLCCCSCSKSSF